jgi:YVTN family beta-propeller protein
MWPTQAVIGNSVSAIDTATNSVVATIAVGANPSDIAISPDGKTAYVTNAGSNTVSVINTSTNVVTTTVTVGTNPVNAAAF